jgi:hypothetical protein
VSALAAGGGGGGPGPRQKRRERKESRAGCQAGNGAEIGQRAAQPSAAWQPGPQPRAGGLTCTRWGVGPKGTRSLQGGKEREQKGRG